MKKFTIYVKHNDLAEFEAFDGDKKVFHEKNGLPPQFLSMTTGDETEFEIDVATGKILNWDKKTAMMAFPKGKRAKSKYCPWCGKAVPPQYRDVESSHWNCPNCDSSYYRHGDLLDKKPEITGEEKYHEERQLKSINAQEAALNQVPVDDVVYTERFNQVKKDIQKYRADFVGMQLDSDFEVVYKCVQGNYTSMIFVIYQALEVSKLLFENGIFCHFDTDDKTIKVNKVDEVVVRQILRDNDVYANNFLRCENDAEGLYSKLLYG